MLDVLEGFFMKLLKHVSLVVTAAIVLQSSTFANDSYESTYKNALNTLKNTANSSFTFIKNSAICAGLVAVPYFIGKGSSVLLLTFAHKRFDSDIRNLEYGYTTQLYQSINNYYNSRLNTIFINENDPVKLFPLIRYKNDLDFYINSLWCLQIFNIGSERLSQIQDMVAQLKTLRANIVSWPQFTEEAQRYYAFQQRQNKPRTN